MIGMMKPSAHMLIEIELFNSKGEEQVAEFDLLGFTAALAECGPQ